MIVCVRVLNLYFIIISLSLFGWNLSAQTYEVGESVFIQSIGEENGTHKLAGQEFPQAAAQLIKAEILDSGPKEEGIERDGQRYIRVSIDGEEKEISLNPTSTRLYRRITDSELTQKSRSPLDSGQIEFPFDEFQTYRIDLQPGEERSPTSADVVQLQAIYEGLNSTRYLAEVDSLKGVKNSLVVLHPATASRSSSSLTFASLADVRPEGRVIPDPRRGRSGFVYANELTPFGLDEPPIAKDTEGRSVHLVPFRAIQTLVDEEAYLPERELRARLGLRSTQSSEHIVAAKNENGSYVDVATGLEFLVSSSGERSVTPVFSKAVSKNEVPPHLDDELKRDIEFGQGRSLRLPAGQLYLVKTEGEWRVLENIGKSSGGLELSPYSELSYQTSSGIRVDVGDQVQVGSSSENLVVSRIHTDGRVELQDSKGNRFLDLADRIAPSCVKHLKALRGFRFGGQ